MRVYSHSVYNWTITGYVLDESASTFKHWILLPYVHLKESDQEKQNRISLENAQTQAAQGYYNSLPWQQDMAKQQMDLYNKQMQSQIDFQNQYMKQSQDQFSQYMGLLNSSQTAQKAIQDKVTGAMSPYLTGDVGYTPEQMKALNTQGMAQVASGYGTASGNLAAQLLAHGEGGDQPLSGSAVSNMAELQSGMANQTSGMRNTNLLSSYNQALTNKFNAASAMMGVGNQLGADMSLGAGGANSSLAGFGAGANSYAKAPVIGMPGAPSMLAPNKPPGFWSGLMSSFAPAVGSGLATMGLGGVAGLGSMFANSMNNSGLMNMADAPLW